MEKKGTDYFWNAETGEIVERETENMENVKGTAAGRGSLSRDEETLLFVLEAGGTRGLDEALCAATLEWDITRVTFTARQLRRKGLIRTLVLEHYVLRRDS